MSEDSSLVFKTAAGVSAKFSKIPAIRKFESLVSDEEFETAGFKIARHPLSETCLIVPASQFVFADEENRSNKLFGNKNTFLQTFSSVAAEERTTPLAVQNFDPVVERISELRSIALEDELPFSEDSATEALEWLQAAAPPATPSVFLLTNGNLRFLWRRGETQLGIQFLGAGTTQFVFLGKDEQAERIFGSLPVNELLKRIGGLDLSGALGF
jgi:hypothetical protein